jgi:hypothetical protein
MKKVTTQRGASLFTVILSFILFMLGVMLVASANAATTTPQEAETYSFIGTTILSTLGVAVTLLFIRFLWLWQLATVWNERLSYFIEVTRNHDPGSLTYEQWKKFESDMCDHYIVPKSFWKLSQWTTKQVVGNDTLYNIVQDEWRILIERSIAIKENY